ncbi:AAA family ATPase [Streptomyces sp. NPDC051913]|uniref:AAA family ATPase n=1 Tax=Streptomyces sp. NPDC051913 TaxID=3365676 RepID=UPI0037D73334
MNAQDRFSSLTPMENGQPPPALPSFRHRTGPGDPGFVGRAAELRALRDFLIEATDRGAALVVPGQAGAGKSALLEAAVEAARADGMRVLRCSGIRGGHPPDLSGLLQIIWPVRGATDLDAADLDALFSVLVDGAPTPGGGHSWLAFTVLEVLTAVSHPAQPLLVAVDDWDALDEPSRQVLAFVARRVQGHPLALLMTTRPHRPLPRPATGLPTLPDPATGLPALPLGPLSPAESALLLASRRPHLGAETARELLATAAGNPLALLELPVPSEDARPAIPASSDRLAAAMAPGAAGLPAGTRDLLLVAALHPEADLPLLLAAASRLGGAELDFAVLAPAERAGLVAFDGLRARFGHPATAGAVVHGTDPRRCRAAHAALSAVLPAGSVRMLWHRSQAVEGHDPELAARLEAMHGDALEQYEPAMAVRLLRRAADLHPSPADQGRCALRAAQLAQLLGLERMTRTLAHRALRHPLGPLGTLCARALTFVEHTTDGQPPPMPLNVHATASKAAPRAASTPTHRSSAPAAPVDPSSASGPAAASAAPASGAFADSSSASGPAAAPASAAPVDPSTASGPAPDRPDSAAPGPAAASVASAALVDPSSASGPAPDRPDSAAPGPAAASVASASAALVDPSAASGPAPDRPDSAASGPAPDRPGPAAPGPAAGNPDSAAVPDPTDPACWPTPVGADEQENALELARITAPVLVGDDRRCDALLAFLDALPERAHDSRWLHATAMVRPLDRAGTVLVGMPAGRHLTDLPVRDIERLGQAAMLAGDPVRAMDLFRQAERRRFHAQPDQLPWALLRQGLAHAGMGSWAQAEHAFRRCAKLADSAYRQGHHAAAARLLLDVVRALRTGTPAAPRSTRDLAAARRSMPAIDSVLAVCTAWALVEGGDHASAFPALSSLLDAPHTRSIALFALVAFAEAAKAEQASPEALAMLDRLETELGEQCPPAVALRFTVARAVLADEHDAQEMFKRAFSEDLIRWPYLEAPLRLAEGRWLRLRRQFADSQATLRQAAAAFTMLGAEARAPRIAEELRASGERADGATPGASRPAAARDLLTARELRIAELAARGLSNREIGEQLGLAPRTIGAYLYRVFPRLGVTSRAQLAEILRDLKGPADPPAT